MIKLHLLLHFLSARTLAHHSVSMLSSSVGKAHAHARCSHSGD